MLHNLTVLQVILVSVCKMIMYLHTFQGTKEIFTNKIIRIIQIFVTDII